ncbi:MAG: helix-turn-helix transcriptional regulator [Bacteroidetes bacterium]|nr:helix-turn-helix transcriptional regulator [Bacteroidota bacterium]
MDSTASVGLNGVSENIHPGIIKFQFNQEDASLMATETTENPERGMVSLSKGVIHFYFCLEGSAVFGFGPHYSRELKSGFNYFFYNPETDLPCSLSLSASTRLIYLSITLKGLHDLFVHDLSGLPILEDGGIGKKFYDEREILPGLRMVLTGAFNTHLNAASARLFYQGKILEILSLYFSSPVPDLEYCPFLNDQSSVRKIKHAKDYLIRHADNPPRLKDLAKIAGLNEFQLKTGFKQVYGQTVYGYLLEHKLEQAKQMLDSGKLRVNEVAFKIGYANPSHFIAAFRKKFGSTPKKYLMNR